MDNLTLTLSVDQTNVVLAALAKLPFESVADLIVTIRQQAQAQLDQAPVKEQEAPPADAE